MVFGIVCWRDGVIAGGFRSGCSPLRSYSNGERNANENDSHQKENQHERASVS